MWVHTAKNNHVTLFSQNTETNSITKTIKNMPVQKMHFTDVQNGNLNVVG